MRGSRTAARDPAWAYPGLVRVYSRKLVVDAQGVAAGARQVLSFFGVMSSPDAEQNTIFLYNSRGHDGRLRHVSYKFEAQLESAVHDAVFASVLDDLKQHHEIV